MINYLFSDINKEKGFTEEQSKLLKKDILPNSTIALIVSNFNDYEQNDQRFIRYITFFTNIGITFKKSSLIDNRVTPKQANELIDKSDIIFLLGGIPELQMKSITEYKLTDNIKKSKFIIGVSAGAMNQSNRVMYKDDFDNFIMKDYQGLGIANINIFPHFELENLSFFEEAKEVSKEQPLILLPNDSFIRIEDKKIQIIGKSYNLYKEELH